jgi:hypothetical protein
MMSEQEYHLIGFQLGKLDHNIQRFQLNHWMKTTLSRPYISLNTDSKKWPHCDAPKVSFYFVLWLKTWQDFENIS